MKVSSSAGVFTYFARVNELPRFFINGTLGTNGLINAVKTKSVLKINKTITLTFLEPSAQLKII